MSYTGGLTDWQIGELMGMLEEGGWFLSVHSSNPLLAEPSSTEMGGLSYTRAQMSMVRDSDRVLVNAGQAVVRWDDYAVPSYVGAFTEKTGGTLRFSAPLVGYAPSVRYILPARQLFVLWPD